MTVAGRTSLANGGVDDADGRVMRTKVMMMRRMVYDLSGGLNDSLQQGYIGSEPRAFIEKNMLRDFPLMVMQVSGDHGIGI